MAAAYEQPVLLFGTFQTGEDDSSNQFTAMTWSGANVIKNTSAGGNIAGVLQNNPGNGKSAEIMAVGITKMVAGAALSTIGTVVKSDTSGRAIARSGSGTAIGTTLTTAAGAGDLVTVLLNIQNQ